MGSFLLIPPTMEVQNLIPPTCRSELVSDWLKFSRARVETLRRLLFRTSIIMWGRGVNGKDPDYVLLWNALPSFYPSNSMLILFTCQPLLIINMEPLKEKERKHSHHSNFSSIPKSSDRSFG